MNPFKTDLWLHHLFSRLTYLGICSTSWLCWFSDPPSVRRSFSVKYTLHLPYSRLCRLQQKKLSFSHIFKRYEQHLEVSVSITIQRIFLLRVSFWNICIKTLPQFPFSPAYSHQSHNTLCFNLSKERGGAHKSFFHSHWNVVCNILKGWCGFVLVQRYFLFSTCHNVLPFALCSSHSLDHIKA